MAMLVSLEHDEAGGMYMFAIEILVVPDVISIPCCSIGDVSSCGDGSVIVEN